MNKVSALAVLSNAVLVWNTVRVNRPVSTGRVLANHRGGGLLALADASPCGKLRRGHLDERYPGRARPRWVADVDLVERSAIAPAADPSGELLALMGTRQPAAADQIQSPAVVTAPERERVLAPHDGSK